MPNFLNYALPKMLTAVIISSFSLNVNYSAYFETIYWEKTSNIEKERGQDVKKVLSIVSLILLVGCSEESIDTPVHSDEERDESEMNVITEKEESRIFIDSIALDDLFGFANESGTKLIAPIQEGSTEENAKRITKAVGENGKILSIKYEFIQNENEKNNRRDTAQNFDNLAGYLFTINTGTATANETYYLMNESNLNLEALLPITSAMDTSVKETIQKEIENKKDRTIRQSFHLADIGENGELYLINFEKEGEDYLFSIVYKEGAHICFMDYPVASSDPYSVWRVDDGGNISTNMFSILFAGRTENGLLLAMNWLGAEGINSFLLEQNGDSFESLPIQYSRYTAF